ncbi:MAG TPA: MBL fold metallo-hydrolase [Bryobacteraceae bacterium]|nr:MBL fold metallo-hydrolase [Bryobacteraceae bacterium]
MPKTRVVLCVFTVLAAAAVFVARSQASPEIVRQIVPGVWFREGDIENLGHCNNVVIEMKDYLIVVDANMPGGARATLADARRIAANKPVKYVFVTHHHGDHAYGTAVWTKAGATTLAFKPAVDELARLEPQRWQDAAKKRKDVAELGLSGPEPPTQVISEDFFLLNDGKRKVEFRYFGAGHSRGDGFVYLPKEQVLITGDAVVNGPYNYFGDSTIANWPNVVRTAQKLKIRYVLPGHGVAGGKELLAGQEQFLVELHKAVKAGVDAGRKPEEITASLELPESARKWVGEGLGNQVNDIYKQLTAPAQP